MVLRVTQSVRLLCYGNDDLFFYNSILKIGK